MSVQAATHLALLRGVNVGGKNMLPMKELAVLFSEAGCKNVRTYIQSGNVVFSATAARVSKLAAVVASETAKRFGFEARIILRTREELGQIASSNPFLKAGAAEDALHVFFLADLPKQGAVDLLDPLRSPPDEFVVRGREIYVRFPNGMGRTKLSNNYFDSKLGTISTARNWRTVLKLFDLMQDK